MEVSISLGKRRSITQYGQWPNTLTKESNRAIVARAEFSWGEWGAKQKELLNAEISNERRGTAVSNPVGARHDRL
jgi:hypothetical protein